MNVDFLWEWYHNHRTHTDTLIRVDPSHTHTYTHMSWGNGLGWTQLQQTLYDGDIHVHNTLLK